MSVILSMAKSSEAASIFVTILSGPVVLFLFNLTIADFTSVSHNLIFLLVRYFCVLPAFIVKVFSGVFVPSLSLISAFRPGIFYILLMNMSFLLLSYFFFNAYLLYLSYTHSFCFCPVRRINKKSSW